MVALDPEHACLLVNLQSCASHACAIASGEILRDNAAAGSARRKLLLALEMLCFCFGVSAIRLRAHAGHSH